MNRKSLLIGLIILVILVAGFTCIACGISVYGLNLWTRKTLENSRATVEVVVSPPESTETPIAPIDDPIDSHYSSTLDALLNAVIPINDPIDLARRLDGLEDIPLSLPVENLNRQVGEKDTFWVSDTDSTERFQISATLGAVTDHLYFWIEDGVDYSKFFLDRLVKDFEENIYPTNRDFFGHEWFPGVDEDPHIYVIYARGLGDGIAGYYSSVDEYHPLVNEFSNAHETFMLNADTAGLAEPYTYGVLAHEFQHMIHWYRDRNESSWLNEGFAELATLLTGHRKRQTHDYYFAKDPDIQLNDWPNDSTMTGPHYGNSFLFLTYFMDRFGSEAAQALVADELNGLKSIDKVLLELGFFDPVSGNQISADDVVLDWMVTNYLKDQYNTPDRFRYLSYQDAPQFFSTDLLTGCSNTKYEADVHQYGTDYIEIICQNDFTLQFKGQQHVQVIPENPYSGYFAIWSNKGDQSNMRLTREFDFSDVGGPLTFSYWTWYDLEQDYDYVFLEVSRNGMDWEIIRTPSSTSEDPTGNSYGWGYNGLSGGDGSWIQEEVDLSPFAGEVVQLRFDYITDAAVHGEGFLLDSISIPEIAYFTDFETDNGGWIPEGFVRIENTLPQTYRLALIYLGDEPKVEYITVSDGNQMEINVSPEEHGANSIVLVVTGTTRFTRQKAKYSIELTE